MKIIYSELQKLIPALTADKLRLRDDLTLIGHFVSSVEQIENETVFDLEIRQNRGDCLGYYGIARDLSVFYRIPLCLPQSSLPAISSSYRLPINVTAEKQVKRIQAIRISRLQNSASPPWLKKFLNLHQVNSINTLVDLTNYVMFIFGLPNHAFDVSLSTDNLVWELNRHFSQFTTLDGSVLPLPSGILMVNNPTTALSLSFLGGQSCAISHQTTETVIEMAVYDRTKVRQDYRLLKTTTEAAIRLDKDLDPKLIPIAFTFLINQILQYCRGEISSQLFDYYPSPSPDTQISFDPELPSLYAGIDIPVDFATQTLERLGCQLLPNGNKYSIVPPSIRKDINLEEDLIEEVVRFYGYHQIPKNSPIPIADTRDITPKILYLIEKIKDDFTDLGYDEIRSWPLVNQTENPPTAIITQNSINSDFPYLRQSIIQSLRNQHRHYLRLKLVGQKFFEVGKIFWQENSQYIEQYSLGISNPDPKQLSTDIEKVFGDDCPKDYQMSNDSGQYFAQIVLDNITPPQHYSFLTKTNSAIELTSQIITLDANVSFPEKQNPADLIKQYSQKINQNILWQLVVVDEFFDQKTKQFRYTFRASYYNCDDKLAKNTHSQIFGLKI